MAGIECCMDDDTTKVVKRYILTSAHARLLKGEMTWMWRADLQQQFDSGGERFLRL